MPSKWDRVRGGFNRAHSDLFDAKYSAEFFNHSQGSYDPATGEMTGQTRVSIESLPVEIVPPSMDSTIDNDGTSFDWTTSIRVPIDPGDSVGWGNNWGSAWGGGTIVDTFVPLGVDSQRPTEVEIQAPTEGSVDVYELHSYNYEKGSGMVMARLVEQ